MISSLVRPTLHQAQRPLSNHVIRALPTRRPACNQTPSKQPCPHTSTGTSTANPTPPAPLTSRTFWASPPTWRRAGLNTLRCLIGCTAGDFSAMFYLQSFHADLGVPVIMALSSPSSVFPLFPSHPPTPLPPQQPLTNPHQWHPASAPRCSSRPSFCVSGATGSRGEQRPRRRRA